jgi:hypothetical protein
MGLLTLLVRVLLTFFSLVEAAVEACGPPGITPVAVAAAACGTIPLCLCRLVLTPSLSVLVEPLALNCSAQWARTEKQHSLEILSVPVEAVAVRMVATA